MPHYTTVVLSELLNEFRHVLYQPHSLLAVKFSEPALSLVYRSINNLEDFQDLADQGDSCMYSGTVYVLDTHLHDLAKSQGTLTVSIFVFRLHFCSYTTLFFVGYAK